MTRVIRSQLRTFIFGIFQRFFTLNRYQFRSRIKSIQSFVGIQFYCRSSLWYKLSKDPSDSVIHLNFYMKFSVLSSNYFKIFSPISIRPTGSSHVMTGADLPWGRLPEVPQCLPISSIHNSFDVILSAAIKRLIF